MNCENEKLRQALQSVTKMVNAYVEKSRYLLNPEGDVVSHALRLLAENKVKYGLAYCPCKPITGVKEKDWLNICPCRAHKEEISAQGSCGCGLFVSQAYIKTLEARKKEAAQLITEANN